MKIYFVHPGENKSGELTSNGVWQLKSLIRSLVNHKINVDRIYVNGHNISRQTGNILSKSLKVPIFSDERFVEINKSVILGDFKEGDIENLENVNLFVDEIISVGKDVIITIGGGIHRAIISRLAGFNLDTTKHFSLSHGSISLLEYHHVDGTGIWRIAYLNYTTHWRFP